MKRSVFWMAGLAGLLICTGFSLGAQPSDPPGVGAIESAWVPDEIVVVFRDAPAAIEFDRLRPRVPGTRACRSLRHRPFAKNSARRVHPLARVRIVKLQSGLDVPAAAVRISRIPGVAYAHPNYITVPAFEPNDPRYSTEQYGPQRVRADDAWDITTGDPNIVVAIADSGLRFPHEDFLGATWENENDPFDGIDNDDNGYVDDFRGWDFMNDDNFPGPADGPLGGHGTHVAGIATARINNAKGIAGMSNCTIMVLQVFDLNENGQLVGTWTAIAEAIHYAVDNGAHVLNFSGSGRDTAEELSVLAEAVTYAWNNDMTVVAAAGNRPNDLPHYPAGYPETIAVAGTTPDDTRWIQSSLVGSGGGPHIDVAAPALNVISTWSTGITHYHLLTGTSMAAPHVTGLVALMYSVNPNLHVDEIRDLLRANAVDLGAVGFDVFFGWGRIDAKATLDAIEVDNEPPSIVHDGGISTHPFSGYIDSRGESSNGKALDVGIDTVIITFSEPVRDFGSGKNGELTGDAFTITGAAPSYPDILSVDATDNPTIQINLSGPIPVGEWTMVIADVEDLAGNRIVNLGDLGEGVDESDRLDIGFLPGDFDQSRQTLPQDLIRFRAMLAGNYRNPIGEDIDYGDINRDGAITSEDLFHFRQLIAGTGQATRSWVFETLSPRP